MKTFYIFVVALIFGLGFRVSGQNIDFDLDNIPTTTSFDRKGSVKLFVYNIPNDKVVKVSSEKLIYKPNQIYESGKAIKPGKKNEVFVINLNDAAAVNVTIEISKGEEKSEYTFTINKEKYWDVTVSAGIFYTSASGKKIGWSTLNTNDEISNLDTSGLFKISVEDKYTGHAGLNTLSHVMYQFCPSFGLGMYTGVGISFTEKVNPQIQLGLSIAMLKRNRLLFNLGVSSVYGNTGLSPFISQTSIYSHTAIKQIELNDHIEKGFGMLSPNISITYQIF